MDKRGLANPELSSAERQILSDWLAEFEQTWSPAKLVQCVPDLPGKESRLRRSALLGMVLIDMRRNWQGGKQVLVEQYVAQFPELSIDGGVADELLQEEFELRRRLGQTPSSKQFALRFPAQADSIRRWAEKAVANPAATAPEPVAPATIPPSAETPGQHSVPLLLGELSGKFGRYHIERRLGRGGMGTVYLARDTQLERYVALKIPNFSDNDGAIMAGRFRQEARAAARLQHTNICSVFDVGQVEGVHYLTMSYVEGEPLSQQLKAQKTLPVPRAVELARRMAVALEYAHKHGVIHRDLKPSNIMIDRRGEPVVMDFGLARREDVQTTRLTLNGETLGTLFYMPPEQLRGELDGMGPHSDVYSLGVILFEMLTGRVPFDGAPAEIVGKLLTEEPPPVAQFRPELTGSPLNDVIRRAMEKQAANRFPSMKAFAAALAEPMARAAKPVVPVAVAPRPPVAAQSAAPRDRPPSEPETSPLSWRRTSAPERRKIRIVVVAALLLAAAAIAAGVYLYVTRPPSNKVADSASPDGAPHADDVAGDDDAEKQGDAVLEKPPTLSSPKPPDTPRPGPGKANVSVPIVPKPKSAADAAKAWQSQIDFARAKIKKRDFDGARADLTLAVEFAPNDEKTAFALLERANVNFERGDFAAARADADRGATLNQASRAEAAATLAKIHCATWDYDEALAACNRVPENHARYPLAQAYRVLALAEKQEWAAAQKAIVKSSANWNDLAIGLYARAKVMFLYDRWPTEALALLARAIDREPANAAHYVLRGRILAGLHRHDDAIKEFDAAAALTPSLEPLVWKLQTYETKFRMPVARQVNNLENGVTRRITLYERFELNPEAIDAVLARGNPETAAEWHEMARLWRLKKNNVKAAEALDKALTLQPRCLTALFARAFVRVITAKGNFQPWDPLESTCRHASLSIL